MKKLKKILGSIPFVFGLVLCVFIISVICSLPIWLFWNFVLVPVFSIKSISLIQAFLCMMFISIIGNAFKTVVNKKG